MRPGVACRVARPDRMFVAPMSRIFTLLLLSLCLGAATARAQIFLPQTQPQAPPKPQSQVAPKVQPQLQPQAQPQPPPAPRTAPYDRDLQRLSEILGALHFLRGICGSNEGQKWRNEAQALIDAEAPSGERHDQMVSSFNRGYRSFQQSYRTCTPAADLAIRRYLDEGAKIAREITARYAN
jgi:uncharacterized protein (TIGR02301 family)